MDEVGDAAIWIDICFFFLKRLMEEDRWTLDTRCNGGGYVGITRPYALPRV